MWGWDRPGQQVTVRFGTQTKSGTARAGDGAWRVDLDPMPMNATGEDLSIAGSGPIRFRDVLVGEVWLCSGQSNMQKPLGTWRGQPIPTDDYQAALASANYPLIRMINEEISNQPAPSSDIDHRPGPRRDYPWKGWVVCSPASLDEVKFSAVGYYFGRKLFQELGFPIGLIEATAGGTHIEAWTPRTGFSADPALADFARAALTPGRRYQGTTVTTLYNGMVHPVVPFALRGVIWYQGESNLLQGDGAIYANKMAALITGWRAAWHRELPFYFVQLPPLRYSARSRPPGGQHYRPWDEAVFREGQADALRLPRTGMVVTTDLGDLNNMHPPHKRQVGERLALWALRCDYGRKDIEPSGPLFTGMSLEGGRAVLHFAHIGGGLVAKGGGVLDSFEIAGRDGRFVRADAAIRGTTVVVSSREVPQPREVRFGWSESAEPNLYNEAGLPAAPFRSDHPLISRSRD